MTLAATTRARSGFTGAAVGAVVLVLIMSAGLGAVATLVLFIATLPVVVLIRQSVIRRRQSASTDGGYPLALALPSASFYVAFFAIPMVLVVLYAFATRVGYGDIQYGLSWSNFDEASSGIYIQAFVRSLRFAIVGTLFTLAIGFPFAYWLARHSPVKRRNLLLALVMVPFLTSFLIRAYAWRLIFSEDFVLADTLRAVGLLDGPLNMLNSDAAVQIGIVYGYLPLFVLPVYATLERMNWSLVDAAKDLGSSGFSAFRQITLPVVAPGVIAGSLLVFIPMTGEYIIPQVLGGGRVDFAGTLISRAFLAEQNYPFGAALGLMMVAALSMFMALYLFMTARAERSLGVL